MKGFLLASAVLGLELCGDVLNGGNISGSKWSRDKVPASQKSAYFIKKKNICRPVGVGMEARQRLYH